MKIREDIFVTIVNCDLNRGCRALHIEGTPSIFLIYGENPRYWPRTKLRNSEDWEKWISMELSPSLRLISGDIELKNAKQEPSGGGSAFLLETESISSQIYSEIADASRLFKIFNDTFVYAINRSIRGYRLTAFPSQFSSSVFNPKHEALLGFIEKYKFGILHSYDPDEFGRAISSHRSMFLVVCQPPSKSQLNGLNQIAHHLSGNIILGWASVEDQHEILARANLSAEEPPLLIAIDEKMGCRWIWKRRISEAISSGMVDSFSRGKCGLPSLYAVESLIPVLAGFLLGLAVAFMFISIDSLLRISRPFDRSE